MNILIIGGGRFAEKLLVELIKKNPEELYIEIVEKVKERAEALSQLTDIVLGKPLSEYYGDVYVAVNLDAKSEAFLEAYNPEKLSRYDSIIISTGDDLTNLEIAANILKTFSEYYGETKPLPKILVRLNTDEFSEIAHAIGLSSIPLSMISKIKAVEGMFLEALKRMLITKDNTSQDILKEIKVLWHFFKDLRRSGLVCVSIPGKLIIKSIIRTQPGAYVRTQEESQEESTEEIPNEISLENSRLLHEKILVLGCKRSNGDIEIATSGRFTIKADDIVYLLVKFPKGLDKILEIIADFPKIAKTRSTDKESSEEDKKEDKKTEIFGFVEELDKLIGENISSLERHGPLVVFVRDLTKNPTFPTVIQSHQDQPLDRVPNAIMHEIVKSTRTLQEIDIILISRGEQDDKILLRLYGIILRTLERARRVVQSMGRKISTPLSESLLSLIFITYDPTISSLITLSSKPKKESEERKQRLLDVKSSSVLSEGVEVVSNSISGIKSLLNILNTPDYDIIEINVPKSNNSLLIAYKVARVLGRKIIENIKRLSEEEHKVYHISAKVESIDRELIENLPITLNKVKELFRSEEFLEVSDKFMIIAIEDEDGDFTLPYGNTNIIRPEDSHSKKIYVIAHRDYIDNVRTAFMRLFNEYPWVEIFKKKINEIEIRIKDMGSKGRGEVNAIWEQTLMEEWEKLKAGILKNLEEDQHLDQNLKEIIKSLFSEG